MRGIGLRALVDRAVHAWRASIQLRTVAITVLLSTLAIVIIGAYISVSVRNNIFDSRRDQLEGITAAAAAQAQTAFDTALAEGGVTALEAASGPTFDAIRRTTGTPGESTPVALWRSTGQDGLRLIVDVSSPGFPDGLVSDELRDAVSSSEDRTLFSQSVAIPVGGDRTAPGLVIGTPVFASTSDRYELYVVYDLTDAQATLDFVQQTLALGTLALVALIGAVAFIVVRFAIDPLRRAAETSERLAAGELDERLPEKGEDVIATLARSFNRMADSLQQQITRLAALSRVQQRFVSDVSHELRTPLTTIRLAGDMLYDQRGDFAPETARTAELLRTQVERFESLLADLLEMSRFDAGAVHLETEPTNLVRLLEDSIESVAPLAASKGSDVRLVAPGGYFEADVDARRIRRIVQNLLANAIDHGEGRPIVVHVDSDANAVAIAVRDYGIGLTADQLERVFDRFWRADPSRQRTTGGTGLGLAISLEDAALHGGSLDVWSERGEGSCFRLTIPRRRNEPLGRSPIPLPPVDAVPERQVADA